MKHKFPNLMCKLIFIIFVLYTVHQIDCQVDNLFAVHLKRRNSWPPDVSALDALNDYTWQRYLTKKVVLS